MSFSGLSIVDDNVIFCRRVGCICFIHPESVHINSVHGLRVVHGGHGAETVGWYFAAHREFTAGNPEHAIWCVLGYGNFVGNRGAKADPPMVGAPSSAETTGESHAVLKTNNVNVPNKTGAVLRAFVKRHVSIVRALAAPAWRRVRPGGLSLCFTQAASVASILGSAAGN
jgi:hypothetical protein